MSRLKPRRIVHRGRVEATGFLFDAKLIDVGVTRRRILDLWAPGIQVYSQGLSYYVRLPAPIRVDCARAPGTPLVMTGDVLTGLPLTADELKDLNAPAGSAIHAHGGIATVTTLRALMLESPESWLDISPFDLVEVKALDTVYEEPQLVTEPKPFDARTKFEGAPAATPELLETIAALKLRGSSGEGKKAALTGGSVFPNDLKESFSRLLARSAASVAMLLQKLKRSAKPLNPTFSNQGYRRTGQRQSGVVEGAIGGASAFLRRLGMRFLHATRLTEILGRRQAAYMAKMMDMFEGGDLSEALRHAIPLNDLPALGDSLALGLPTPRSNLAIVPQQQRSARIIAAQTDLMTYLRQLYRSAFERLVAQRRFEEAAFVLAELLRNNEEAVAFLERHQKFRLAAELAEARELPPGMVVRQWFLAGEVKRAIGIARRTQSFADAIFRLEKTNKDQAEKLRLIWAEALAEGGNYAGAVDVIWSLEAERMRAREWMDQTVEVGGPVAARMLGRKLSLVPEEFANIRPRCLAFLEDESFEHRAARLAFAEALCSGTNNLEAKTLARVTARAILRDAGEESHALQAKQFRNLVDFSGDGALRTDVPPFPSSDQAGRRSAHLRQAFFAADCGSMPIADAAILGDGRMLVALGEAGVKLLTRDGRTVTHFDQPAHCLVLSDHGDRAIALARRGEVWRLARLDLLARRSSDWCETQIDAFASNYDGSLWFIGSKGDFYAIDATAEKFEALWRVPDAGEKVIGVARSASSCSFLTVSVDGALEQWVYRLPLLTLRSRTAPSTPPGNLGLIMCAALSPEGVFLDQSLYYYLKEESTSSKVDKVSKAHVVPLPVLQLRVFDGDVVTVEFAIGDDHCQPGQPEILGKRAVSPVYEEAGARVRVIDLTDRRVTASLFLLGARQVSTRLTDNSLSVADDRGRLLVLDVNRNCLARNMRV